MCIEIFFCKPNFDDKEIFCTPSIHASKLLFDKLHMNDALVILFTKEVKM